MKKIINSKIFLVILTALIFYTIGVNASAGYSSDEIYYSTTGNNITSALNELYPIKTELTNLKLEGTALNSNILTGKSAVVQGKLVNGTMVNNGAISKTLNAGGSYTVPAGYHDGTGKVTVNSLSSQTSADATDANILSSKTAWVNGSKITGSMADRGAWTVTPTGTGNTTIPAGYHNGSGYVNTTTAYNNGYNSGISVGKTYGLDLTVSYSDVKSYTEAAHPSYSSSHSINFSFANTKYYLVEYRQGGAGDKWFIVDMRNGIYWSLIANKLSKNSGLSISHDQLSITLTSTSVTGNINCQYGDHVYVYSVYE